MMLLTVARPTVVPAVFALVLAGCASLIKSPDLRPDAQATTIPAVAASTTARLEWGFAIHRWWTQFGDATLEALMGEALARNEDVELALARVREAQANLDLARAALMPTLDLDTQAGRAQQSIAAKPAAANDRRSSSFAATLTASYEVDLWGRLASTTSGARHRLLATEWSAASVQWSLTANVAETYFALAAVDRQIEISEAVRSGRMALLGARRREHAAGAGNEFDVRRAESEVTSAEATLAGLRRQRASLERTLLLLVGRSPGEIVGAPIVVAPLDETRAVGASLPAGDVGSYLVQRPDLRQIESELAAANASIDAARAATLPSVRLVGALGSDARSLSNLFSGPAALWSLAGGVTHALLDGGRARAQVRVEQARTEQTLASYRKAIASAVLDVREAYATLDHAHETLRADGSRVESLARARELAKLGYDNGALSYLELLDAERNWYQAQLDHVAAYRDHLIGHVAAYKALGGGHSHTPSPARS